MEEVGHFCGVIVTGVKEYQDAAQDLWVLFRQINSSFLSLLQIGQSSSPHNRGDRREAHFERPDSCLVKHGRLRANDCAVNPELVPLAVDGEVGEVAGIQQPAIGQRCGCDHREGWLGRARRW
jgi:hypothetical protein